MGMELRMRNAVEKQQLRSVKRRIDDEMW